MTKQPQPNELIDTFMPGKFFATSSDRNDVLASYRTWLALNKPIYTKYFTIMAILFMALLIPFDFILFPDALIYPRLRVIFIVLFLLNVIYISRKKFIVPYDESRDHLFIPLLIPGLIFCLVYEYWLLITLGKYYTIVLIANFMTIFLATFFYHRFWREQYAVNILAICGLISLTFLRPDIVVDSILLIMFHLCSFVLAFFFRRQFVGSMYVTSLKRSREELLKAKERAEISDKMKSVFLSTMSHEVRTPLNVILGYIEILQMSMEQDITDEQKEFICLINEGSTRLIRLMDDILDISRIEAGKIAFQEEVLIGDYVVKQAVSEISGAARQKNMQVIEKYNCPKTKIYADAVRLQQVLVNILGNAVKFTDRGSITITTSKSANEFRVDIQDTGIGIGDSFKPQLFTLFKQAEEGFSRSYEGLGLGLAISQRLIQAMEGHIEVESKPNHGSKFTIILPLYKLEGDYSQPKTKKARSNNKKVTNAMYNKKKTLKLLILEDNPANVKYMEYLLKRLGVEFVSIDSGPKALAQIDEINPDGMLIDISLSEEMDGVEFLKNIRKQDKYKKIPAIAVTAHAMKGMQEQFLTQGFDDYLSKPYTIKGLAEIIDRNFAKSNQS